jgi:chromosome partitioning protein
MPNIITVANLKGGSTKTTSAVFLAHALKEAGLNVIGVDADPENQSFIKWSDRAEFPFPVISMAVPSLNRKLPGVVEDYDAVVIDTPPLSESKNIVTSAARIATHLLIPMAPTTMEYERIDSMIELLSEIEPLRDQMPAAAVILTRCIANATSTDVFRELVSGMGLTVLRPNVARLERYAQAFGAPVDRALSTPYGDAATELLGLPAYVPVSDAVEENA